jgi:hypothetical protein
MATNFPPLKSSLQDLQRQRATIASLISRLMSHYWTADDHPEIRRAQAEDWIADLIEFSPAVVEEACAEWRRNQTNRPTIADIRKLCFASVWEERERPCLPPPQSNLDAQRIADEWAIKRGYMSIEHFQHNSFVGASVHLPGGGWVNFPGLREPGIAPGKTVKRD